MSLDLDLQLREFCDFMDETQGPLTIDDILERTGEVPVIPGRRIAVRGRPVSRRLITAAAAVIAVVLVGLALRFLPVLREVPPATEDNPTTTTSTLPPEGAEAAEGTVDTPLGTFSWQHIRGDVSTLPSQEFLDHGSGIVATPSGYATVGLPNGAVAGGGVQYWRSSDGYEWTPEPFPVPVDPEYARLQEFGGGYWLNTLNPPSMWRSDDAETWIAVPLPEGAVLESDPLRGTNGTVWLSSANPPGVWRLDDEDWTRVDTTEIAPPDITGLNWSLVHHPPATVGEITLFTWALNGSPDYSGLGFGDVYGVWDPGTRTTSLYQAGQRAAVTTLSVEAEGNRIIFTDEAGSTVYEININDDRVDAAALIDSPQFGAFGQLSLGILDGEGRFTSTIPPWGSLDSETEVELLAIDGQFLAFVMRRDQAGAFAAELWTSTDGLSWNGPQRPEFLAADYRFSVRVERDVVLAEVSVGDHTEVWVSDDGISWTDTGLSLDNNGVPWSHMPIDSGGIYVGSAVAGYEMFVSADLRTWERIDTSQLGIPLSGPRGLGAGAYAAGDVIFLTLGEDELGMVEMWLLELDR